MLLDLAAPMKATVARTGRGQEQFWKNSCTAPIHLSVPETPGRTEKSTLTTRPLTCLTCTPNMSDG
jgi:hypothetical protein